MTRSSAPAKVFLFGEHAVVYGEPAVLCAVDRRVTVHAEEAEEDAIHAEDLSVTGVTERGGALTGEADELGYVRKAVEKAREEAGTEAAVEVTISSEVPVGAGLGSSAAVVVAAIDAVSRELGAPLEAERVAELGYEVELSVQGSASPSDTYASATGGAVYVEPDVEMRSLDSSGLSFVVGYDGGSAPTGEMVEGVRRLTERNLVASGVVELIGEVTRSGVGAVEENDLDMVGELMNLNHGLLEALGVGSTSLARMVWAAREAGARGAKLTGAGGGGCIVALGGGPEVLAGVEAVAEEAFRVEAAEGVRQE